MRMLLVLCVSALLGQNGSRWPVPAVVEIDVAEARFRDRHKDELSKTTLDEQSQVAHKLLAEFDKVEAAPVDQYVRLRTVRRLAAATGDHDLYIDATRTLSQMFRVEYRRAVADGQAEVLANASPSECRKLLPDLQASIGEAIREEEFDVAEKTVAALKAAADQADKFGPAIHAAWARTITSEVESLLRKYAGLADARKKLDAMPPDGPSHLLVGEFLCFVKDDWTHGLPLLAVGSDPALRNAAERDRKAADGTLLDGVLAGDAWFDVAADLERLQRSSARMRAAMWYRRAAADLAGDPDERLKPLVDKRLDELAKLDEAPQPIVLPIRSFSSRFENGREHVLREGGTAESEAAVARGLAWLARVQSKDGRWKLDGNFPDKGNADDAAGTALGLLPFVRAGITHRTGKNPEYRKAVDAGIRRLLAVQNGETGAFSREMYAHGLCTLALCEAYAMSGDGDLKKPAQRAVDWTVRAQHSGGGWRYQPGQTGDLSVTAGQVLALDAARSAGLDVPKTTIAKVATFLDSVLDPLTEGYGYVSNQPTPTMTAAGLLCRERLQDWSWRNDRLVQGIDRYLKPNSPRIGFKDIYYYYYATQAIRRRGGADWTAWNGKMRDLLVGTGEGRR